MEKSIWCQRLMVMFRTFSLTLIEDGMRPFNPDFCSITVISEVNVIRKLRGSPGNPGFGLAPIVQKFNCKLGKEVQADVIVQRLRGWVDLTS